MSLLKNKKFLIFLFIFLFGIISAIVKWLSHEYVAAPSRKPKKIIDTVLIGDSSLKGSFGASFINQLSRTRNLREGQIETYSAHKSTFLQWLNGVSIPDLQAQPLKLSQILKTTHLRWEKFSPHFVR